MASLWAQPRRLRVAPPGPAEGVRARGRGDAQPTAGGGFDALQSVRGALYAALIRDDRRALAALAARALLAAPGEAGEGPLRTYMGQGRSPRMCERPVEEGCDAFWEQLERATYRRSSALGVVGWMVNIASNARRNAERKCWRQCGRSVEVDPHMSDGGGGATGAAAPTPLEVMLQGEEADALDASRARLAAFARRELDQLGDDAMAALGALAREALEAYEAHLREVGEADVVPEPARSKILALHDRGQTPAGPEVPEPPGKRALRRDLILWLGKSADLRTKPIMELAPSFSTPNTVNVRWKEWRRRYLAWERSAAARAADSRGEAR